MNQQAGVEGVKKWMERNEAKDVTRDSITLRTLAPTCVIWGATC